jgi:hypothetical protein
VPRLGRLVVRMAMTKCSSLVVTKIHDLTQTSYGRQQKHIEFVERTGEEGEVNSLARQVLQQLDPTATVRLAASPLDRQPSTVQNFPHYWQVGAAAVEQC